MRVEGEGGGIVSIFNLSLDARAGRCLWGASRGNACIAFSLPLPLSLLHLLLLFILTTPPSVASSRREKNEVNNTKIYLFSGNKSPRGLRANVYYANRDVISIGAATFPFLFLVSSLSYELFPGRVAPRIFFVSLRSPDRDLHLRSVFLGDARGGKRLLLDLTRDRFSETTRYSRVSVE